MSKEDRPSTAPSRIPDHNHNIPRPGSDQQPEENEDKVLFPLCRKVASMNISIMDNVADNIVESCHCLSADPTDTDIFRFEVVDIFARIKDNCLEQEASIVYNIPIDHICITLLYPTLLKPLYDITRRFNGVLMAEMEGVEKRSVRTLRDLLEYNRVEPDAFVVSNQSAEVIPMNTNLEDLRDLMQQHPKTYRLVINILPHKTTFFAKIFYRHKDEPELEEHDFFTEYRVTTVAHATTLDRGKVFTVPNTDDTANPASVASSSRNTSSRNRNSNHEQQVAHVPEAFYAEEYEPNDDDIWEAEAYAPANSGAANLPVTVALDESDFLAGGDSKYAAMYQQGFPVEPEYEMYDDENQNQPH